MSDPKAPTEPPVPESADDDFDPVSFALDQEDERHARVTLAQNTVIGLLIEKLIDKDALSIGDAIALLEECRERFADDEHAKIVPQSILDFVRKKVVPPPGSH